MVLGLFAVYLSGAFLSLITRQDVFKLRDSLGLDVAPETGVLTLLLSIFSFILVICVCGVAYILWSSCI